MPEGAIDDVSAILREDGSFPYALGLMVPGEPLLSAKLSRNAVLDTLAAVIEPGHRAISVEVGDASGVAGFVLPEHRVDVNVYSERTSPLTGDRVPYGKTLLQNIRVLAVDQSFQDNLEGAALARTVTLQVTPAQARILGPASEKSTIGLVLRPKHDVPLSVPAPRPAPRRTIVRAPVKAEPKFTSIRVIQGESEEIVNTPVAQIADDNEVKK